MPINRILRLNLGNKLVPVKEFLIKFCEFVEKQMHTFEDKLSKVESKVDKITAVNFDPKSLKRLK